MDSNLNKVLAPTGQTKEGGHLDGTRLKSRLAQTQVSQAPGEGRTTCLINARVFCRLQCSAPPATARFRSIIFPAIGWSGSCRKYVADSVCFGGPKTGKTALQSSAILSL